MGREPTVHFIDPAHVIRHRKRQFLPALNRPQNALPNSPFQKEFRLKRVPACSKKNRPSAHFVAVSICPRARWRFSSIFPFAHKLSEQFSDVFFNQAKSPEMLWGKFFPKWAGWNSPSLSRFAGMARSVVENVFSVTPNPKGVIRHLVTLLP